MKGWMMQKIMRHKRKCENGDRIIPVVFMYTILLLSALAISCVMCAQNEILYEKVQAKAGVFSGGSALTISEAKQLNKSLTEFIEGKTDVIYTASERALKHMQDVKDILTGIKLAGLMGFTAFAICVCLLRNTGVKRMIHTACCPLIVFILLLCLLSFSDFGSLFYHFHRLLFTNDLWMIDPSADRMILYLTEEFFLLMAMEAIIRGTVLYVLSCFIVIVITKTFGRRDHR